MTVNATEARAATVRFEAMYSDGGMHELSDAASEKLGKMKAACSYRAALETLPPSETEPRETLQAWIATEHPHLFELFEHAS